jgi:antitoxin (DNA-binding transcriptional repressor) of toxin-antitoxin stability system
MSQVEDKDMKFLSVRDLRSKSAQIWKELPGEREMVVTSNGRPIAILAAITDENLEESLKAFRQARAVEAVASLQRRSVEQMTDGILMEEINAEIKAVRKKRAR